MKSIKSDSTSKGVHHYSNKNYKEKSSNKKSGNLNKIKQ